MTINRSFLAFCRTIHIYLTMLGLFVMLGFGVTGFTAYHEEWFAATTPRVSTQETMCPTRLIENPDGVELVEHVRKSFHISGALTSYEPKGDPIALTFKAPGRLWEIAIDRSTGKASLKQETYNAVAVLNDLHRGRDAGPAWRWVIDVSAALVVIACLTGIVLWLVLPKRRKLGIASIAVGSLGTIAVFWWMVPGPDTATIRAPAAGEAITQPATAPAP